MQSTAIQKLIKIKNFVDSRISVEPVSVEFKIGDSVGDMFYKLVFAMGYILKTSYCKLTVLQDACIKTDRLNSKLNKLPSDFIDKINTVKTLDDLLKVLIACTYCTWINFSMLEKMALVSCKTQALELIAKYKKTIYSKSLADVLQYFSGFKSYKDYYTKVIYRGKPSKEFEDIAVESIASCWANLRRILDLEDLELLLDNVAKDSTEIYFCVPVELVPHARFSALRYWEELFNVSFLSIGEHVIKDDRFEFSVEKISVSTGTDT